MRIHYLDEILEQPAVLTQAIAGYPQTENVLDVLCTKLRAGDYSHVVLTGMGTSLYSCYPLWLSLSRYGVPASMWDTSELVHYGVNILKRDTLLIAVSQSGESVEIKRLISLPKRPANIVGITNETESSLAHWADVVLSINAGEEATVSTKTYVTSLAVLHLLGCQLVSEDLAMAKSQLRRTAVGIQTFLEDWESKIESSVSFLGIGDRLALMGRGNSMATVLTGSLILKEASKVSTTGLSAAQFRHGPMELARPGFKALVFAGDETTRGLNERLAREIGSYGGKVLLVTTAPQGHQSQGVKELPIPFVEDRLLPIIEIIPIQLLAIPFATNRGFQAGVFEHGSKVTTLE